MANCPSCGTSNVYNSGFSVECVNRQCQFFSAKHRSACLGTAVSSDFSGTIQDRKLTIQGHSKVASVKIKSQTAPFVLDLCYAETNFGYSFYRWVEMSLFFKTDGREFSASVEAQDHSITNEITFCLYNDSMELLYEANVTFDRDHPKFEIGTAS